MARHCQPIEAAALGNDAEGRRQANQRLDGLSDRLVPHATYVTSALDALGMHDIGTAKAFEGGASKQSEEIGVRLVLAAAHPRQALRASPASNEDALGPTIEPSDHRVDGAPVRPLEETGAGSVCRS